MIFYVHFSVFLLLWFIANIKENIEQKWAMCFWTPDEFLFIVAFVQKNYRLNKQVKKEKSRSKQQETSIRCPRVTKVREIVHFAYIYIHIEMNEGRKERKGCQNGQEEGK